mgnify:CR=1 FL=1
MTHRKKSAPGPVAVFLITLGSVLLLGAVGIAVITVMPVIRAEKESNNESTMAKDDALWEKIPEREKEEFHVDDEVLAENSRYADILSDEEFMWANRIYPWHAAKEDEVTLCFTGDVLFDDEYAIMANLKNRGGAITDGISTDLLEQMQGADILVVNNEFPYTKRGVPTEGKTYTFRAEPDTVSYLKDMGADVAIIANNHVYDFGEQGLLDTLDTLDGAGVCRIGAGRNLEEASAPVYFIVNDMKIAVIAATQIERLDNPDTKGATENSAGVFRCWNPEKLCEVVAQAKENSDFVIVCIHWGTENESEPDWAQLDQAPKLAKAGADLIIGDHPHCLQGITYCENTPVIYSLGNFWFNSKTVDTGMIRVSLSRDGIKSMQFIPAIQSDCRVNMVYGEERERILSDLRNLSPGVQIDMDGMITR